jgi:hypothetical protein
MFIFLVLVIGKKKHALVDKNTIFLNSQFVSTTAKQSNND